MISRSRNIKSRAPHFCAALACVWLCGCYGRGNQSRSMPPQQAVTQSTRAYELGREPDQEREQAFQDLLEAARAEAVRKHGDASEIGFAYSLSPKGAVYPFSEVEVSCLMQKADAAQGDKLCSDFFGTVDAGLKKIKGDN